MDVMLESGQITVKHDFVKGQLLSALVQSLAELGRASADFSASFRILAIGVGLGCSLWGASHFINAVRGRRGDKV